MTVTIGRRELLAALGGAAAARAHAAHWRADERRRKRSRRKDPTFPVHAGPCRKWLDRRSQPPDRRSLGWRRRKSDTDFRERVGCPTARRDPGAMNSGDCGAATGNPHDPDRIRDSCRSGWPGIRGEPSAAWRKHHRVYQFRSRDSGQDA